MICACTSVELELVGMRQGTELQGRQEDMSQPRRTALQHGLFFLVLHHARTTRHLPVYLS